MNAEHPTSNIEGLMGKKELRGDPEMVKTYSACTLIKKMNAEHRMWNVKTGLLKKINIHLSKQCSVLDVCFSFDVGRSMFHVQNAPIGTNVTFECLQNNLALMSQAPTHSSCLPLALMFHFSLNLFIPSVIPSQRIVTAASRAVCIIRSRSSFSLSLNLPRT